MAAWPPQEQSRWYELALVLFAACENGTFAPSAAEVAAAAGLLHDGSMPDVLRSLRWTALVEAVSYLVLLLVAMPLKHGWGIPGPVRYFGMAHGVLFLLLIWFLARAHFERRWPIGRLLRIFVASLVPVWPFFLDREVRAWIAESDAAA